MILWTIQPIEVYNIIQEKGYYICDESKSELLVYDSFKNAYNWYIEKMIQKVGLPLENIKYPVWAWYKRKGKRKKPDLRESGYAMRGTKMVCMEIEIPDEQVVLSDFDNWHFVLGDYYYSQAVSEEEWDKDQDLFDSLPELEKQEKKIQSWKIIFNIESQKENGLNQGNFIQATFWKLYKEQIKKVQFFVAK